MSMIDAIPTAVAIDEGDLPFVDLGDGSLVQLQQVDLANGVWIIRTRFQPGSTVQTHRHTGHVYAVTFSGKWVYAEYPDVVNTAGTYLYEPAGSVHTLHVPEDNTEVTDAWFAIHGANLLLDPQGEVEVVVDAHLVLGLYLEACRQAGVDDPPVIIKR